MTGYTLTPQAQEDLDKIWDDGALQWGVDHASGYARDIKGSVEFLAQYPSAGSDADHIRPGYRKHVVRSHIIFYRLSASAIEIVRILHKRMDPDSHL